MIRINPTKMVTGGNVNVAKSFFGPAKSQLNILKNQMSFQNLSQGVRKIWLNEDIYVECRKTFDFQECRIWARPKAAVEEITTNYFLIIFATGSGNEAIVWDMLSDSIFMEVDELTTITDKLSRVNLPSLVEAVCSATDNHVWNSSPPAHEHDSPLMLPSYLIGRYVVPEWYGITSWLNSALYPATYADYVLNFWPGTISWELDYVDESPLPYPNKEVLSTSATNDEEDEKASYINTYQGLVENALLPTIPHQITTDFETLTGQSWNSSYDVVRYYQFWHPFFWYSNKDITGNLTNLSADGRGILLADSWTDGEWTTVLGEPVLDKSSLVWHNSGIAIQDDLIDPEVLLFEYVSVCHKFVDTFGSGMCDEDLSDFVEHFRIYEHGKIPLSGLRKEILDLTNIERVNEGTHELVFNSVLSQAAQRHASDQAALVNADGLGALIGGIYEGHIGTDGSTPTDRITDAGYFIWIDTDIWGYKISENCAWTGKDSPAADAIALWKASPKGHWENMIDEDFSEIGIGIAALNNGGYCFVQNFGKVDHRYPGFSPFDTEKLKNYIDANFIFDPAYEDTRQPRMYLVGSVTLNDNQLNILTENK